MRCPACQQENEESNLFCIFCGADLTAEPPGEEDTGDIPPAEDTSDVSMAELQRQVQGLRQSIREIRATLASYGMRLEPREFRQLRPEVKPPPPREPAPDSASVSRRPPTVWVPSLGDESARPKGPPTVLTPSLGDESARPKEPPAPMPWERIQVDWEVVLGGNWLARIGVLAVIIGTAFFLNLAFENKWINETGRVVLGIVGGLAFIGASQYWHKRYPIYAQPLAGGGVALLYLTIFAAFSTYELITLYPAIGLLLLISVASAALALRHESVALAIIGILGAFGAPFILGGFAQTSSDVVRAGPSIQLMTYVMVVDIGVLALSTFRNWRWLTLIALIGSLASFGSWHNEYGDSVSLLTSQGSLTIVFLIFVGATTLYHIIWRRAPEAFDHSLMVINAAAYFGISYGLLWDDFRPWMGGFTLLLSLFYGAIAYITWVRSREHVYLSLMALGIALVFLTIAVPVQLGGPWISVAWAVEGAVLMWLSFTLRMPQKRVFSVGVFAIFAAWLLILDTPEALSVSLTPFLNRYFPAYLVSIGATYLAAYLLRRNKDHLQEWETMWFPAFLAAANLFLTVMVTTQVDGVWVTITWAVEAVALMWLSFRLGIYELRLFSLGVFATMAVRLLAFDTPDALSTGSTDSLSIYLPAYLVSIGATYLAAYLLRRYKDDLQEWETMWVPAFIAAGSLFLTVMVPTQVDGVWTTVTWAIEAVALMWLSFRLGIYELRLFSLGVFATMAVRLLAFDTPVDLEDFRLILNLRMVAFGSGILALYLASYLTIRGRNALQEWEKVDLFRALPVGASFLTLWVSSAEVINAVDSGIVDVTGQTADSVKSQGLSLLWGVYASVVLVLGFVRGWRQVRVAGLGLLAVPILKLFLIDTFELERGYRVAAFLSLGGLLLVSGFLYQRYSGVIKGFLFEEEKPLSQS